MTQEKTNKKSRIKKTGLFFGSYNPVHIGHTAIANYIVEFTEVEEVWFILSPQNPLKRKESLLKDYHRLELLRLAILDDPRFRVSDIEFRMPKPSFTIDTLVRLQEKYENHRFSLIMGADNLLTLPKWKNFEQLLSNYSIIVYPRKGSSLDPLPALLANFLTPEKLTVVEAPTIEISSTALRQAIAEGKDMRFFFSEPVYTYIRDMHFYEK